MGRVADDVYPLHGSAGPIAVQCFTRRAAARSGLPAVFTRRAAGPVPEGPMKRSGIVEADIARDRGDRVLGTGEPLNRDITPQFVLQRLKCGLLGGEAPAQRAHRAVKTPRGVFDGRHIRQQDARYCLMRWLVSCSLKETKIQSSGARARNLRKFVLRWRMGMSRYAALKRISVCWQSKRTGPGNRYR